MKTMCLLSRIRSVLLLSLCCSLVVIDALETVAGGVGEDIYQGLDRSSLNNGIKRTRFEPIFINGIQTVGSESSVVRSLSRTGDVLPQRNRRSPQQLPTAAATRALLPSASSSCHVTCVSIKQHPVCASDGRTYSTKCHMRRHNKCENQRLRVVSKGRCLGETPCQEERRTAIHDLSLRPHTDLYIPECTQDGAFQQIQCHDSTGYCWCVSVDGRPIPGSSVLGHNLTCSKQDKNHSSKVNKRRRGVVSKTCGTRVRSIFNSNLLGLFNEEFLRVPPSTSSRTASYNSRDTGADVSAANASALPNRRVLEWKFSELDADSDGQLNRNEVQSLRYMVVKLVHPRSCAQSFHNYCDLDNNKLIALKEWTDCLSGSTAVSNISMVSDAQHSADGSRGGEHPAKRKYPSTKYRPGRVYPTQNVRPPGVNQLSKPVDRENAAVTEANRSVNTDVSGTRGGRGRGKGVRGGKQSPLISGTNPRPVSFLALINRKSPGKSNGGLHHSRPTNAPSRIPTDLRPSPGHRLATDLQSHKDPKIPTDTRPPSSPGGLRPNAAGSRSHHSDDLPTTTGTSICAVDRTRAHSLDKSDPLARIYIPECETNGMYRRAQCHNATGYCFCVDDSTGVPIPGTSTHNATPDCSEIKTRKIKGCPFVAKKRFLTDLLDHITQEMVERINNGTIVGAGEPDPDQTIEERAVRWKLRTMDTNNNNILEKSELKEFRDELNNAKKEDEEKHLRKCRRNFLNYCDEDGDASISTDEWVECIGLNEQSSILPENPKRKGPNPFSTMLKS